MKADSVVQCKLLGDTSDVGLLQNEGLISLSVQLFIYRTLPDYSVLPLS